MLVVASVIVHLQDRVLAFQVYAAHESRRVRHRPKRNAWWRSHKVGLHETLFVCQQVHADGVALLCLDALRNPLALQLLGLQLARKQGAASVVSVQRDVVRRKQLHASQLVLAV
jgi:hypothetical protein